MIYKGYTITSDNTIYKNGVHAAKVSCNHHFFVCWFDRFTDAIEFINCNVITK